MDLSAHHHNANRYRIQRLLALPNWWFTHVHSQERDERSSLQRRFVRIQRRDTSLQGFLSAREDVSAISAWCTAFFVSVGIKVARPKELPVRRPICSFGTGGLQHVSLPCSIARDPIPLMTHRPKPRELASDLRRVQSKSPARNPHVNSNASTRLLDIGPWPWAARFPAPSRVESGFGFWV